MNNKLEVIGIDHGWSMMKTISQVFVTGVKEITTTQALFGDVLEYEGKHDICCKFPDHTIITYRKVYRINKNDRIHRGQRTILPFLDSWKEFICDIRYHSFTYFKAVNILYGF